MASLPANKGGGGTKSSLDTNAAQLTATVTPCVGVVVQNDPDNTVDILVGFSAAQVHQVAPGGDVWIGIDDVSKVYAKTVSGTANVNYTYLVVGAN